MNFTENKVVRVTWYGKQLWERWDETARAQFLRSYALPENYSTYRWDSLPPSIKYHVEMYATDKPADPFAGERPCWL